MTISLVQALSGGVYPVSAVLSSREILLTIKPGEHGSTFGGNPLGCAVATAALEVIVNEDLSNRAERLGNVMRAGLEELKTVGPDGGWIKEVRGKGLLNAIVIDEKKSKRGRGAWELCLLFKSKGLLAKVRLLTLDCFVSSLIISNLAADSRQYVTFLRNLTLSSCTELHLHSIRLAPPIIISEEDLAKSIQIIKESLEELDTVSPFVLFDNPICSTDEFAVQLESIPGAEKGGH